MGNIKGKRTDKRIVLGGRSLDYSKSDIDFMRKDAIRRTREMHSQINKSEMKVQAEKNECNKAQKNKPSENKWNSDSKNLFSNLFSDAKLDNDKIILIILIIFLAREGTDLKLLIALGYILM